MYDTGTHKALSGLGVLRLESLKPGSSVSCSLVNDGSTRVPEVIHGFPFKGLAHLPNKHLTHMHLAWTVLAAGDGSRV